MTRKHKIVIGIAWYRPQDWMRLRALSTDCDELEDSHAEWVAHANKVIRKLEQSGQPCERVLVDLDELVAWCRSRGHPLDGAARSEFVSEKVGPKA